MYSLRNLTMHPIEAFNISALPESPAWWTYMHQNMFLVHYSSYQQVDITPYNYIAR